MAIETNDLLRLRPFVFHSSDELNFSSIRRTREIRPAEALLRGTQHERLLHGRRARTEVVQLPGGPISIRDHRPFRPGSAKLEAGCSVDDYISLLI
jgi:hypothetical protein